MLIARRRLALLALTAVLGTLAAPPAHAGGTQVGVVAVAGRVWVTSGYDVVELDSTSARIVRRVRTRYPYPIAIGVSDGALWVTSVENGFVSGALTRIPFERGRVSHPLVLPRRPVLALAVDSGTTWVLAGPWSSLRLVGVDQATRRRSSRRINRSIGWIAADNTGRTPGLFGVAGSRELVRIDRSGRSQRLAPVSPSNAPVVGYGSVWVLSRVGLSRIDARSGRVLGRIAVPAAAGEVALGGGFVWILRLVSKTSVGAQELVKVDPVTMAIIARVVVRGSLGGMSFGNGAVWIGRSAPTVGVLRVDPCTLRHRLFATIQ